MKEIDSKEVEDKETLLMGYDGAGSIIIQKGKQIIRIVPWEVKVLKKFLDNVLCK